MSGRIKVDYSISPERLAELKAEMVREDARIEEKRVQLATAIKEWLERNTYIGGVDIPKWVDEEFMNTVSNILEEEE